MKQYNSSVSVGIDVVSGFTALTRDTNKIHIDNKAAEERGYKGCILPGALLQSYGSAFITNVVFGDGVVLVHRDVKFVRPIYVPETIQIYGVVDEYDGKYYSTRLRYFSVDSYGDRITKAIETIKVVQTPNIIYDTSDTMDNDVYTLVERYEDAFSNFKVDYLRHDIETRNDKYKVFTAHDNFTGDCIGMALLYLYSGEYSMNVVDDRYRNCGIAYNLEKNVIAFVPNGSSIWTDTFRHGDTRGQEMRSVHFRTGFREGELNMRHGYPNQRMYLEVK